VTALAGFLGSKSLSDEVAHILLQTWPQQVAAPITNEIHNVLTQTRSGFLTISVFLAIYVSSSESKGRSRQRCPRAGPEIETLVREGVRRLSVVRIFGTCIVCSLGPNPEGNR